MARPRKPPPGWRDQPCPSAYCDGTIRTPHPPRPKPVEVVCTGTFAHRRWVSSADAAAADEAAARRRLAGTG